MICYSVSAKVARGNEEHWQSIHRQRQAKGFLTKTVKTAGELLSLSQTPAKDDDRTANRML
jgi:hypothetical protein